MKIESQQDLSKLLDLLRKKGIKRFKSGDIELDLFDEAPPSNYKRAQESSDKADKDAIPDWNDLTDEEKLFYSTQVVS